MHCVYMRVTDRSMEQSHFLKRKREIRQCENCESKEEKLKGKKDRERNGHHTSMYIYY